MSYIPDPFNYTMKRNPPKAGQEVREIVAGLSHDEIRQMAWEKLSEALQAVDARRYPDTAVRLSNAVLDRLDGKPVANVNLNTTTMLVANTKADASLLKRIRQELITDATYETLDNQ